MPFFSAIPIAASVTPADGGPPWSKEEFERKLREKEKYYHIQHEFHQEMNAGRLDQSAIQGWVANRFYYQVVIPMKDAAIMANCPHHDVRRRWIQRIIDHDGDSKDAGGIEAWLQLGDAVGLKRDEMWSHQHVLPGVRFAVDSYISFAKRAHWQEAACSSLTEMFAPTIHQKRLDNWPQHYPWIKTEGYHYFRKRLREARRDVVDGIQITLDSFTTRAEQEHALNILQFKLDILWSMLDSMWLAYIAKKPPYWNVKK
jgi:pyrroloquinoline-quinone synthase